LTTGGGREFQVAGAAQLKDRWPMTVRLNCTSRNRTANDQVPLHALMWARQLTPSTIFLPYYSVAFCRLCFYNKDFGLDWIGSYGPRTVGM